MECGQEMNVCDVGCSSVVCVSADEYSSKVCSSNELSVDFNGHSISNGCHGNCQKVISRSAYSPLHFRMVRATGEKSSIEYNKTSLSRERRLIDTWSPFTNRSGKNISQLKALLSQCLNRPSGDASDHMKSELRKIFTPFFRSDTKADRSCLVESCKMVFAGLIHADHSDKFYHQLCDAVKNLDPRILYGILVDVVDLKLRAVDVNDSLLSSRCANVF